MSAEDPTEDVVRRFNEMAERCAVAETEVERLRTHVSKLEDQDGKLWTENQNLSFENERLREALEEK